MTKRWFTADWTRVKWTIFSILVFIVLLSWFFPSSDLKQQSTPFAEYSGPKASRGGDNKPAADTRADSDYDRKRCSMTPESHTDCHPDPNPTQERCLRRGCCWLPAADDAPPCFVPVNYTGYKVMSRAVTASGTKLTLFRNVPCGPRNSSAWVTVEVTNFDVDTIRVRITDTIAKRVEPPLPLIPKEQRRNFVGPPVAVTPSGTLAINGEGSSTFEFHLNSLIFSEQLNQLRVQLPATIIYGLKSPNSSFVATFQRSNGPLRNAAFPPKNPAAKFYGGHPFFAMLNASANSASGLFLLNSNEVDVLVAYDASATFRTTGGVLDFFVFRGPTLSSVTTQYQKLVGFPSMPPYHLLDDCKTDTEDRINIADDTTPVVLEAAYDVLKRKAPNIPSLENLLVRSQDGHPLTCSVMGAGSKHFVDFTHPAAQALWQELLSGTRDFENKVIYTYLLKALRPPCCNAPELRVSRAGTPARWMDDATCPTNVLHLSNYGNLRHVYPEIQAKLTSEAIAEITRKRVAVVSDKTFPGQGRWSGYFARHPEATWHGLNNSLADLLRYNMYGMPLFGTLIGNFDVLADEEHCVAWLTLATFFPIYRYKSGLEQWYVSKALKDSIAMRKLYMPYMYTLFYESSRFGKMVVRPLAFEFQDDPGAREIDHQFMWGPSLLIAPRVLPGYSVEHYDAARGVYFPKGTWYDWQNGKRIHSVGQNIFVPVSDSKPGIYVRGGTVVPVGFRSSVGVVIAPDTNGFASGILYSDDGVSLYPIEREQFSIFNFFYANDTLVGLCTPCKHRTDILLDAITIFGRNAPPKRVLVNGRKVSVRRARTTMYVRGFTHPLLQPLVLVPA